MGLNTNLLRAVAKRIKPGMLVCSFGYPDIVAPPKEVGAVLGSKIYGLKYHYASDEIAKWHHVHHRIPDAHAFFELLGCELDVWDIVAHRGRENICDLNIQDEPRLLAEKYDMVIDIGSAEHCFNIGSAIANMARVVKKGGTIFHENPFNWGNHGFWNLNPTVYADFYGQNGFTLQECWLCPKGAKPIDNVERQRRFTFTGGEANVIAIAERVETRPIQWPVQGKYRSLIPTPGTAGEQLKEAANG
jgi:hypothetical protein